MIVQTLVRDCLYLNWALPVAGLPEPPAPLRYELHPWRGEDYVFASALLFRHEGMHLSSLPLLRFSFPQANLRLYTLDAQGVPSVLFLSMLVPLWALPGARWMAGQPASSARLRYPRPSRTPEGAPWHWSVARGAALEVSASQGSPQMGEGPCLGSWERTVEHLRRRPRGYSATTGELRRVETSHPAAAVWPLVAEIGESGLLAATLPLAGRDGWPPLHSAWLCPEIPFAFQPSGVAEMEFSGRLPQPAASQRNVV
jgi:Uncharacterized conserved protein (COG2071)